MTVEGDVHAPGQQRCAPSDPWAGASCAGAGACEACPCIVCPAADMCAGMCMPAACVGHAGTVAPSAGVKPNQTANSAADRRTDQERRTGKS